MLKIEIKCQGSAFLSLNELTELQGKLKVLSDFNFEKLKTSILKNGFTAPFFVWKHDGKNYLLDGHQRLTVLTKMQSEYEIPPLPVCEIFADSIHEAKKKLLVITSQYGEFTKDGTFDFLKDIEDVSVLDSMINFKVEDFDLGGNIDLFLQEKELTFEAGTEKGQGQLDEKQKTVCPKCGNEW